MPINTIKKTTLATDGLIHSSIEFRKRKKLKSEKIHFGIRILFNLVPFTRELIQFYLNYNGTAPPHVGNWYQKSKKLTVILSGILQLSEKISAVDFFKQLLGRFINYKHCWARRRLVVHEQIFKPLLLTRFSAFDLLAARLLPLAISFSLIR